MGSLVRQGSLGSFLRDMKYSGRSLWRQKTYAMTVTAVLSLTLACFITVFAVFDAVMIRSLPYPASGKIIYLWNALEKVNVKRMPLSLSDYEIYRSIPGTFETTAYYKQTDRRIAIDGTFSKNSVLASSSGLITILGIHAEQGRTLTTQDWQSTNSQVAMVSSRFYRDYLHARDHSLPLTIRIDEQPFQVVGVLPATFTFSNGTDPVDIWVPLAIPTDVRRPQYTVVARLQAGISLDAARKALGLRTAQYVNAEHPYRSPNGDDPGYSTLLIPIRDQFFGPLRDASIVAGCTAALMLCAGLVNIIALLAIRATRQWPDTQLRMHLGASSFQLITPWLAEILWLFTASFLLAIVLAVGTLRLFRLFTPPGLPVLTLVAIDGRILFAIALAALFMVAISTAFLALTQRLPNRSSSKLRKRNRLFQLIIMLELLTSSLLVLGALAVINSRRTLEHIDVGFDPSHLVTFEISFPEIGPAETASTATSVSLIAKQIEQLPSVSQVGEVSRLPVFTVGADTSEGNPYSYDGHSWDPSHSHAQLAHTQVAGSDYFSSIGVPLLEGRPFSDGDTSGSPPVTIVNKALATEMGGNHVLGSRILIGVPEPNAKWMTIIGVIGDLRTGALDQPPMPQIYTPIQQTPVSTMFFVVRTKGDPVILEGAVTQAVRRVGKGAAVNRVMTMNEHISSMMDVQTFQAWLLSLFAAISILLSSLGLYAVLVNTVLQRRREIAIRMSLGSSRARVATENGRFVVLPAAIGIVFGLSAGVILRSIILPSVYGQQSWNIYLLCEFAIAMIASTIIAIAIPVYRAAMIDPAVVLRSY